MTFHIITMSTYGTGLSGGDRIWIELAKRITKKYSTYIYLWEEGLHIAKREDLKEANFILWSARKWSKLGFFINYFARILISILNALKLKMNNQPQTIVYSASEFWQDSLPAIILKLRYPKIKWLAAWYQTAPNPFLGFSERKDKARYPIRALPYYLFQLPIKPLINKFADLVIVNNDNEKKQFSNVNKNGRIFVMLGAVNLKEINSYKSENKNVKKIYDGVFQGRFHPQKGVIELIDIWKIVTSKKPNAKLAMIGDGPLMDKVLTKIKKLKLEENISIFGYIFDGPKKYKIFSQSKIVVHPSFYDSGGMASAEAMAFSLPVVGFDLIAYESYYPKGMIKVQKGNLYDFAEQVLLLLNDPKICNKAGKDALSMVDSNWSWDIRAKAFLNYLNLINRD